MAWHAKEVVRAIYDHDDPDLAVEFVDPPRPRSPRPSPARPRSASSAAPSCAGGTRSPRGTKPTSPTGRPKR